MKKPEYCDLKTLAETIIFILEKTNLVKVKSERLEFVIIDGRIDIKLLMSSKYIHLCLIDLSIEPPVIRIFPFLSALDNEAAKKLERFANSIRFRFDIVQEGDCDQIRRLLYKQPDNEPLILNQ